MNRLLSGNMNIAVTPHGAELQSLVYNGVQYLYQKTEGFWQRQSPILFPIVGKLKNDTYEHEGRQYNISQHGFLRDKEWENTGETGPHELAFRVRSDDSTREKYPWDFESRIRYIIEDTTLRVEYSVTNTGAEALPFSLGGHPAFRIEGRVSEYSIAFDNDDGIIECTLLDQEQKGLLSGHIGVLQLSSKTLPLSEDLFRLDALIFRNLRSKKFTLLRNGKKVFTFDRGNFPHFALWRQPNAPFLCFEPWQGYSDNVNSTGKIKEKAGIVELALGETKTYDWSIKIDS